MEAQVCGYCGAPIRELVAGACPFCRTLVLPPAVAEPGTMPVDRIEVWLRQPGPQFITVIKEVRRATGLGLKEAKALVDAATDGAPMLVIATADRHEADTVVEALRNAGASGEIRAGSVAPPPAGSAPPAPVAAGGQLDLVDAGANLIAVIKVVRRYTGLGLREAKDLVDGVAPGRAVAVPGVAAGDVAACIRDLTDAGARVQSNLS